MPAETHSHSEGIDLDAVLDLMVDVLALDHPTPEDVALDDAGLADEVDVLHLWATVAEELSERSVGEIDLDDLAEARTLGALATVFHDTLERRHASA